MQSTTSEDKEARWGAFRNTHLEEGGVITEERLEEYISKFGLFSFISVSNILQEQR